MKNAVRMHPLVYIEPFVALLIIANGIMILGLTCVFTYLSAMAVFHGVCENLRGFLGLSRCMAAEGGKGMMSLWSLWWWIGLKSFSSGKEDKPKLSETFGWYFCHFSGTNSLLDLKLGGNQFLLKKAISYNSTTQKALLPAVGLALDQCLKHRWFQVNHSKKKSEKPSGSKLPLFPQNMG